MTDGLPTPRAPIHSHGQAATIEEPAVVTARRLGKRFADVPDMTPEEYQRRADADDALFRDIARRIAEKT